MRETILNVMSRKCNCYVTYTIVSHTREKNNRQTKVALEKRDFWHTILRRRSLRIGRFLWVTLLVRPDWTTFRFQG